MRFLKEILDEFYPWFLKKYKGRYPMINQNQRVDSNFIKKKETQKGFGYEWRKFPKVYDL